MFVTMATRFLYWYDVVAAPKSNAGAFGFRFRVRASGSAINRTGRWTFLFDRTRRHGIGGLVFVHLLRTGRIVFGLNVSGRMILTNDLPGQCPHCSPAIVFERWPRYVFSRFLPDSAPHWVRIIVAAVFFCHDAQNTNMQRGRSIVIPFPIFDALDGIAEMECCNTKRSKWSLCSE